VAYRPSLLIVGTILLASGSPSLAAQWRGAKDVRPSSCALADSLLGPPQGRASVYTNYKPSVDTSYLQSGNGSPAKLRMIGMLVFSGRGPVRFPAPTVSFLVGRGQLATWLVTTPTNPDLTLMLDDTTSIRIGRVPVGRFNGPADLARAPINVQILPAWALALARARTAALTIESSRLPIPKADLRAFEALYRFATCDTLQAH